jgi:hypothetical protein
MCVASAQRVLGTSALKADVQAPGDRGRRGAQGLARMWHVTSGDDETRWLETLGKRL